MSLKYVILSHARTGSNLLVSSLAQHPDIESHNELFHQDTIFTSSGAINDRAAVEERDQAVIPFLNKMLERSDKPAKGFKHLLFNNQEIIDYVMNSDFYLILLERKNILAQYSSLKIALNTRQWTVYSDDEAADPSPLVWDATDFETYRKKYVNIYNMLKRKIAKRKYPAYHVYYVDLPAQKTLNDLFAFLEVPGITINNSGLPLKQNTQRIIERFTEPETVRKYLKNSNNSRWESEEFATG